MADEKEWIKHTVAMDDFTVDVGFLISGDFYYGAPNDWAELQSGRNRTSLHRPILTTPGNVVLVSSLGATIDDLATYYADVLANVQAHNKNIKQCLHYFWIRPYIIFAENAVGCPWYDRYYEVERFLSALVTIEGDGEIYWDCDQGWELNVVAEGERVHIREWDPDDELVWTSIHCPSTNIKQQSRDILAKTNVVMEQLRSTFGEDYWSMKSY